MRFLYFVGILGSVLVGSVLVSACGNDSRDGAGGGGASNSGIRGEGATGGKPCAERNEEECGLAGDPSGCRPFFAAFEDNRRFAGCDVDDDRTGGAAITAAIDSEGTCAVFLDTLLPPGWTATAEPNCPWDLNCEERDASECEGSESLPSCAPLWATFEDGQSRFVWCLTTDSVGGAAVTAAEGPEGECAVFSNTLLPPDWKPLGGSECPWNDEGGGGAGGAPN